MKLISCYVSSFGKLKDFSYEFTDGLNTIKEENGWGKSTFSTFIKAMFYGLDDSKRSLDDNERKKFTPWNSTEKFGGNLVFDWNGKQYKIERFFGSKISEDTIKLTDLSTGKSYTEGASVENLGKRVFSIDEEGFLSTTYFSQKEFEVKGNSSITEKFNEVCEVQDQSSFDIAVEKITEKIRQIKTRGDKGKLSDLKREISFVNDKIERSKKAASSVSELKEQYDTVIKGSEDLNKEIKLLTEKIEVASKKEAISERKKRYDEISKEKEIAEEKIADAKNVLNGKSVSKDKLDYCRKCISDLNNLIVRADATAEDLNKLIQEEKPIEKVNNKQYIILGILSALAIIVGLVLSFTVGLFMLMVVAVGLIFGLFAVFMLIAVNNKKKAIKNANDSVKKLYNSKNADLDRLNENISKFSNALDDFFSDFNLQFSKGYSEKYDDLTYALSEYDENLAKIKKAEVEMRTLISLGIDVGDKELESVSELNVKLKTAGEWYKQKVNSASEIKLRMESVKNEADMLIDYEARLNELKEEYSKTEKDFNILSLTLEYLKTANENLKTKYRAPLQNSLTKYLKQTGVDLNAFIDTEMKITVEIGGADRETGFFSKGYRNLFEICKRFALTDVLFTGEKPFIILDDPFYNLDEDKIEASTDLIKKLSAEYQILYLICHESRRA